MDDVLSLELPFTDNELDNALSHLGSAKTPGWDGLTVEFYLAFWDDLKDVILSMINEAWANNWMPQSWKQGILKLIS